MREGKFFCLIYFYSCKKLGGLKGGPPPPPHPPPPPALSSARSLVMCYNSFFACSYNNLNTSLTEAKPWKIGGSIVAQFYLREIVFEKKWYTSVAHVSFDEIHRTVITYKDKE